MTNRSNARRTHSDQIDRFGAARSALAVSVLLLGAAGSLAVLPFSVWLIAARGFH